MIITLRIKKRYLDEIAMGIKKFEYRKRSERYDAIFTRTGATKPTYLVLHYQSETKLLCHIKSIEIIETKTEIDNPLIPTKECWKIGVSDPILFTGKIPRWR